MFVLANMFVLQKLGRACLLATRTHDVDQQTNWLLPNFIEHLLIGAKQQVPAR